MGDVVFVDTSVLLNVLDVPGKNSDHVEVASTFKQRVQEGHTFVIPATSVIEVGNHIAQLSDGDCVEIEPADSSGSSWPRCRAPRPGW